MKRVLAFCFFPAFVPPTNGGQSRIYHFYKALSQTHHVTLLTSTHPGVAEEIVLHGDNFIERRIPKDSHFAARYGELDKLGAKADISGPALALCGTDETPLHKAYLDEYQKCEVIIHDFPFTIDYDIFAGIDRKPRIYNAHNCETVLYRQLHQKPHLQRIIKIVEEAEVKMLRCADAVLYCCEDDLAAFVQIAPDATYQAIHTPNGMEPRSTQPPSGEGTGQRAPHALFMGSGHPPNAEAARFIAQTLAPAHPDVVFDIVGNCLPQGRYAPNVRRHGVVDDETKNRLLAGADVALNPMRAGSGSNVKCLEYFAAALPVVATRFGMRGLDVTDGEHYIEASLDTFSAALRNALADPERLKEIGAHGRDLALARYTWSAIAKPVAARVQAMATSRERASVVVALNDYDSFATLGGGATRTRGLYQAISAWKPVVFLCFSTDGALTTRWVDERIAVIAVPMTHAHRAELAHVNALDHVSVNDIVASRHCRTNPWLMSIYEILRPLAQEIVVEHCYLADVPQSWGDRFIYSSQNNETELKERLLTHHPLRDELLAQVARVERLAVECSRATVAVSREDAEGLVRGKRGAGAVLVVPNGADMPATGPAVGAAARGMADAVGARAAVFVGSAHMPNVEAAQCLVREVAPRCPSISFHFVGSVCDALAQSTLPRNVRLWGRLDDATKTALMQACQVALNPVVTGSGSNIKLADYLAHGLYVVTTAFGCRGYPDSVARHVAIASRADFPQAIAAAFGNPDLYATDARADRHGLFVRELAMAQLAQPFLQLLQAAAQPRRKVLFVTYRYTAPSQGGAEATLEKFLRALGESGEFDIDVVTLAVSGIHNASRFGETYAFDLASGAPVGIPNLRFARFPVDEPERVRSDAVRRAWSAQPAFERVLDQALCQAYDDSGLSWGWGNPETDGRHAARWSYTECGLHLQQSGTVRLRGYADNSTVASVYRDQTLVAGPWQLGGAFELAFEAAAGSLHIVCSATRQAADLRPLGLRVTRLSLNGVCFGLSKPTLVERHLMQLPTEEQFRLLGEAARQSRGAQDVHLTDGRGPWSAALEAYLAEHVAEYDLVITHNSVFRPAIVAIAQAHKQGVSSILIPHAHLDDDFYHFPDVLQCAQNANLVMATPRSACDYLAREQCCVEYLPSGCDADETFSDADRLAFAAVYKSERPYVLVLGRKAPAKGYTQVIAAVEQLNGQGYDLNVVLIGPDDDGLPLASRHAFYLGRQPREVVRGALMGCIALCNMSSSESFGMVVLEAWLAGCPPILNQRCAAFRDLATDGVNALLVVPEDLAAAIQQIIDQPGQVSRLAEQGRQEAHKLSWKNVCHQFVERCKEFAKPRPNLKAEELSVDVESRIAEMARLKSGGLPHEEDFLFFKALNQPGRPIRFLDVGANTGQSAISFYLTCPNCQILSLEPNPLYQPVLEGIERLLGSIFEYRMYGLADENLEFPLYIPCVDGEAYMQEASMTLAQFDKPWVRQRLESYGKQLSLHSVRVRCRIADEFGFEADVVKIDAEGAEFLVVNGMKRMIQISKPIFMIENNDFHRITAFLADYGYRPYRYDVVQNTLQTMSGDTANTFYLTGHHFEIYGLSDPGRDYLVTTQ